MNLHIENFYELNALWAAIMEAKFHDDPDKPEVQGSPLVSNVAERVLELMIEHGPDGLKDFPKFLEIDESSWMFEKVVYQVQMSKSKFESFEEIENYIFEYLRPFSIKSSILKQIYAGT
jgi:hypothetical protein